MNAISLPDDSALSDASHARRFAVLGLGRTGIAYAMAASRLEGCALSGFVEPRGSLRAFARGAGFDAPAAPTLAQLIARAGAHAAVIATPRADREAAIEAALTAGLAVLVDGLPVPSVEAADRLAPRLAAAGAPVGCAVGTLFHPLFARASQVLGTGGIGEPRDVRASVYLSRVFAAGAPPVDGDVLDFAVADLLVLLDALFGPVRAASATGNRLYGERFDEVHATLEFAGGLSAGVDGSWSVPGYPCAAMVIEVIGSKGALLVSDDALETDLPAPCGSLPAGHTRRVLAEEPDPATFEAGLPGRALAAFACALEDGRLPDALHPAPALRTVRVIDALRRSAAAKGERVEPGA
jgi:predicted dehydrogenase